jgi:hypothetical protein
MRNYLELGKWNAICDRCGFKRKNDQLRKEWTGLMVCADTCWESKHPQLMLRVPEDNPSVPWARTEPADTFVEVGSPLLTEDGEFLFAEDNQILLTET